MRRRRLIHARFAVLACAAAAGLLGAPGPAQAARGLEVSIMDDQLLIGASEAKINRQMRVFQALGVDRLRVSAFWRDHSPANTSRQMPAGFDPANPLSPGYSWDTLDRLIGSAAAHGLNVMVSITTPAPSWAAGNALGRPGLRKPSPQRFAQFAGAVATRYAAFVDRYAVSNEPNQPGWLMPQSDGKGLFSPHHYRAMIQAAYPRIKAADADASVVIGELSSSGRVGSGRSKSIPPLAFLREMACVNRRYRPIRRGRCSDFQPVPGDGLGHHPYAFFTPPTGRSRGRDDAGIGDGRKLVRALDRLTRRGRIDVPGGGRLPVYYTEFGYQTNPPDPFGGISLRRQDRYLQIASYVAWRTPRVREINQFRLTDGVVYKERGPERYREFQSGLLFVNRRKKPAFRSFPHPFVITRGGFWGQIRPGSGARTVRIQRQAGRSWLTVGQTRTDRRGYFFLRLRHLPGRVYRFTYDGGHSSRVRAG
jgi:hypothetical protein